MTEKNKADLVREYLEKNPNAQAKEAIEYFKLQSIELTSSYFRGIKSRLNKKGIDKPKSKNTKPLAKKNKQATAKYPRHGLEKSLRIPTGIMEQNAGKECTEKQSADFINVKFNKGPFSSELSSCIKYGLLERPRAGYLKLTDLAMQILRPKNKDDELNGLRNAVLLAPDISTVYEHYRGENLPDTTFFNNTLADTFKIPAGNISDFSAIFFDTLKFVKLIDNHGDKYRIIDFLNESHISASSDKRLKNISKNVKVSSEDTCFVMMPFSAPFGDYYSLIYKPAIEKAGLKPVRADDDIFSTGKIIDQIWKGINESKVLVAELTSRNANVFYELGLAHALNKPVVLVSSNEDDVPFDLHHIRVIYYDKNDPFWGQKLLDKVAENVISAIKHPEEALFQTTITKS